MMKLILVTLLLLPLCSFAQEKKSVSPSAVIKKQNAESKVTQEIEDNDVLIKQFDKERGTFLGTYHTSKDQSKLSLAYHINPSISFSTFADVAKISTIEAAYTYKMQNFWLNFLVQRTSASVEKILENPVILGSTDSITTFGIGLYQRFHLFDNFFENNLLYESIEANLTYNLISNNLEELGYSGIGLKSDFGVYYRHTAKLHYGVKFSYNIISAKNSQELTRNPSWISLGFDISFYF